MWHNKAQGSYSKTSTEGIDNANMIAGILLEKGWSLAAVCALMGNGAGESGLNPWRWESDIVPTVAQFNAWTPSEALSHGYGIFQFTPANRYINATSQSQYAGYGPNFSDRVGNQYDGTAQLSYFTDVLPSDWLQSQQNYNYYYTEFLNVGVDISNFYWITLSQFITGKYSDNTDIPLDYLTGAFELCFERPNNYWAAQGYQDRVDNAAYWWNYFSDDPPPTPPTPPPPTPTRKGMPLWMMLRYTP